MISQVCDHDAQARQEQLSPKARQAYHQTHSQPLMEALKKSTLRSVKVHDPLFSRLPSWDLIRTCSVRPNSGQEPTYETKHTCGWEGATLVAPVNKVAPGLGAWYATSCPHRGASPVIFRRRVGSAWSCLVCSATY